MDYNRLIIPHLLAGQSSLAFIHRTKGIKEETVIDRLQEAANQAEEIEGLLSSDTRSARCYVGVFRLQMLRQMFSKEQEPVGAPGNRRRSHPRPRCF